MSVLTTIRQTTVKNSGVVTVAMDVGDGLRRIAFRPRQSRLSWRPGQALAVKVAPEGKKLRDRWRHYTLRRGDAESGDLEFLITVHDDAGPGARWAAGLTTGDEFVFMGPGGGPTVASDSAPTVIIGDRTTAAAAGAILDALPRATPASVVLATPTPSDAVLDTVRADDVTWIGANGADEIREALVGAADTVPLDPESTYAYVTGEQAMMRSVRDRLRQRGLPKAQVKVHAHWTPGRVGM
ncbi:MAG: siderophore-interacting protein [Actinomycetota bacterium]